MIWLKANTKDPSPDFVNGFIFAEIPDPMVDPLGYALVDEFMVHGPCSALNDKCVCMKNGSCSKRFPKSFCDETMVDELGFHVYRHRDDGRYVLRSKGTVCLGNDWVVPYNMKLLKQFEAHINVKWCNKTNLLKYLFKYLTKGHDVTRMRIDASDRPRGLFTVSNPMGRNEIDEYVKCRYSYVLSLWEHVVFFHFFFLIF